MGSEELAAAIERLRPLLDKEPWEGGYDCCGCSNTDRILDDVLRIVRGDVNVCEHPNLVPRYEQATDGKDAIYVQDCPDCPAWAATRAGFIEGCVLPPLAPWVTGSSAGVA